MKQEFDRQFACPDSRFRGAPFWAWNCKLDSARMTKQIEYFKEMGLGGFHMHCRTGLDTPYMSPEYLQIVKDCVNKAKEEKMFAWLYDEDRYPSGPAGVSGPVSGIFALETGGHAAQPSDAWFQHGTSGPAGEWYLDGQLRGCAERGRDGFLSAFGGG